MLDLLERIWPLVLAVAVPIGFLIRFVLENHKLLLENQELKAKKEKAESRIKEPTNNEIKEFGSKVVRQRTSIWIAFVPLLILVLILLYNQRNTIGELEERNTLLERQLEEYGKYVQMTPEGSVIIGRPLGGGIHMVPHSTLTISQHPELDCNQAWYYIERNKVCAAREILFEALAADTTYYRSHLYLGVTYMIDSNYIKADEYVTKALKYAPQDTTERKVVLLMAALANKGKGESIKALSFLDEALALDPEYGLAKRTKRELDEEIRIPLGSATIVIP